MLARKSRQLERKITVLREGDDAAIASSNTVEKSDDNDRSAASPPSRMIVIAPAGKLGVTVDKDEDGDRRASVTGVKDKSPLLGKICTVDKVVAINDEEISDKQPVDISSEQSVSF